MQILNSLAITKVSEVFPNTPFTKNNNHLLIIWKREWKSLDFLRSLIDRLDCWCWRRECTRPTNSYGRRNPPTDRPPQQIYIPRQQRNRRQRRKVEEAIEIQVIGLRLWLWNLLGIEIFTAQSLPVFTYDFWFPLMTSFQVSSFVLVPWNENKNSLWSTMFCCVFEEEEAIESKENDSRFGSGSMNYSELIF